jgi:hypothetical protein
MIRDGVRILDPVQFALAHHGIGILVKAQERSDLLHALLNAPPNLNPAFRPEIGSKQNVDIGLSPGEEQPLPQAVQRDASCSFVTRVDILIPLGVVELFSARSRRSDIPASTRRSRWKAGLRLGRRRIRAGYSQERTAESLPRSSSRRSS